MLITQGSTMRSAGLSSMERAGRFSSLPPPRWKTLDRQVTAEAHLMAKGQGLAESNQKVKIGGLGGMSWGVILSEI